jgi:hypothetical protein
VGLTVRYITITNCNNGINLTYGDAFKIDHNSITVKGDVGIRTFANPTKGWDWNLIHDNSLTALVQPGEGPDTIQPGDSVNIYNNNFQNVLDPSVLPGQHPDNIQMGGRYVKVYGNTFTDIADSNIDYDAQGSGKIQDVYIYNNKFQQVTNIDEFPEYIRMYSTGKAINTFANVKILNNTFIDSRPNRKAGWGQLIGLSWNNGTGAGAGNEIRNNLAVGTVVNIEYKYGGSALFVTYSNNIYPQKQSLDPSGIVGVPSLDANYIPASSDTLARDHGITLSYFSTDKVGTTRPQGLVWDVGAYEYSSSNPLPPSPPKNLRVQWLNG